MKEVFFLDVDTQKDLMTPSGALYVPGSERMISKMRRIFEFALKHDIFVLSSVDAHHHDDPEFKMFPRHCLTNTEGQRKIEETLLPRPLILENKPQNRNLIELTKRNRQVIIEKQTLDLFSNPVSEKLLRALPQRAIVFGVPLDLSVRLACLGLRRMQVKTALVMDAVRPLKPQSNESAAVELKNAGVEFITLEALLGLP